MNERMPDIVWINYEYFSLSDSITGMYYITWSFVSICVLLIQWFYHVVFLDKEVTRAWIPETHLRPYRGKEKNSRLSAKVPRQLHVRLSVQLSVCPSVCMRETETQVWPLQSQRIHGVRWVQMIPIALSFTVPAVISWWCLLTTTQFVVLAVAVPLIPF